MGTKVIPAKKLLRDAAKYLRTRGVWTKGTLRNEKGQVCALGAIYHVAGTPLHGENPDHWKPHDFNSGKLPRAQIVEIDKASAALDDIVEDRTNGSECCIEEYNDRPGIRKSQVVEVIEKAAEQV